jgi:diguanylate cyclase (GGDEF)-like protein
MAEILVVDDDSQAVEQVCRLIGEIGHTSDFLVESRFLIPKMETRPFDLVLLDVNMPDVDGLTLLKELKSHPTLSQVPVIMVTGETGEGLISECFQMGAVDFVNKPIRPLEIQSRVRIALETQQHIRDINKKNSALKRAKAFSETVLNSMEDAIVVVDKSTMDVVDANQVFLEKVEKPRKSIMGKPCFLTAQEPHHPCSPCEGFSQACLLVKTLESNDSVTQEFQSQELDNKKRFTKIITIPIKQPGQEVDQILFIARDITKARLLQDRLKHLAFHDVLTGLPNRLLFYDRIHQSLAMSRRHDQFMAVMFFDLDRFKKVNDTLGHDVGDQLLVEVAKRLSACVRKSDTIARMGGDEFTAVLNEVENVGQVKKVANKILKSLGKKFHLCEHALTVTSSIGVALFPQDGENMEELTKHADQALYQAKGAGRNNVQRAYPVAAGGCKMIT